jgi:hypothetical protein
LDKIGIIHDFWEKLGFSVFFGKGGSKWRILFIDTFIIDEIFDVFV